MRTQPVNLIFKGAVMKGTGERTGILLTSSNLSKELNDQLIADGMIMLQNKFNEAKNRGTELTVELHREHEDRCFFEINLSSITDPEQAQQNLRIAKMEIRKAFLLWNPGEDKILMEMWHLMKIGGETAQEITLHDQDTVILPPLP